MKKIFAIHFLLMVSQIIYSQKLKMGIEVNPGISWLDVQSRYANMKKENISFSGSLNIDYYFSKNYAFSSGLGIGKDKAAIVFQDSINFNIELLDTVSGNKSLLLYNNFINVPIGFKFKTQPLGKMYFFTKTGFYNQFYIKSKAKVTDQNGKILYENDFYDYLEKYNIIGYIGGGIEYIINVDNSLRFGVTYQTQLISILKNVPKVYTNTFSLNIGFTF